MKNRIINGDAREKLENLNDEEIDLVVTSPPYYNSSKKYQRGEGFHYSKDVGEPLYSILEVSEKLYDKLKDDGFYCLNLGFSYGETGIMRPFRIVEQILKKGWFAVDIVVWHKPNPVPLQGRLTNSIEYIFVFAKNPHPDYPDDIGYEHNFIESSVASPDVDSSKSSAPFPIELPEYFIKNFTEENDLVCDPYFGIGTTGLASKKLSRNFIGIEINEEYCEVARKRINSYQSNLENLNSS